MIPYEDGSLGGILGTGAIKTKKIQDPRSSDLNVDVTLSGLAYTQLQAIRCISLGVRLVGCSGLPCAQLDCGYMSCVRKSFATASNPVRRLYHNHTSHMILPGPGGYLWLW